MPVKRKNSGKTERFMVSYPTGRWHLQQYHGWEIWMPSDHKYERYSPRHVATAHAVREFWRLNRGTMFPWRDTIAETRRSYLRGVTITRDDYSRAKEIIREVLFEWPEDGTGRVFVYASSRGSKAISGFIDQQDAAEVYESKSHRMFAKFEGRVANGTVVPAGAEFGVPVKQKTMKTQTLR